MYNLTQVDLQVKSSGRCSTEVDKIGKEGTKSPQEEVKENCYQALLERAKELGNYWLKPCWAFLSIIIWCLSKYFQLDQKDI